MLDPLVALMCSLGSLKKPRGQKELSLALHSGKGRSAGCDVKDLSCSYDCMKLINKIFFPLTRGPVIQNNLVHVLTGSSCNDLLGESLGKTFFPSSH